MKPNHVIMGVIGIAVLALLVVVSGNFTSNETANISDTASDAGVTDDITTPNSGGFNVEVISAGSGTVVEAGQLLTAHYTGTLEDGSVFDTSLESGTPLQIPIGSGFVIPCWDKGIVGQTVGSKLKLTCPPETAYGERGVGDVIPANATLFFDVEILNAETIETDKQEG